MIFATGNMGKLREIKDILGDIGEEIISMKEAGIDVDIEENGTTFEENAIIKAKAITATIKQGNKLAKFKLTEFAISIPGTLSDPSITPIRNAIVNFS